MANQFYSLKALQSRVQSLIEEQGEDVRDGFTQVKML
jgi:hypothetical protein